MNNYTTQSKTKTSRAAANEGSKPNKSNLLSSIQTKLTIGQPDDEYEKEADSVADQVMRMPLAL